MADESTATLAIEGLVAWAPLWEAFHSQHSDWYGRRRDEGAVVHALPVSVLDRMREAWRLTTADIDAEKAFTMLCKGCSSFGVYNDIPLRNPLFVPRASPFPAKWYAVMGWGPEQISAVEALLDVANDIQTRMKGAAGRLVCDPRFLKHRDRLKSLWDSLDSELRPDLPLFRSVRVDGEPGMFPLERPSELISSFAGEFDAFCDLWRLVGLTTWNMPDVDGPKWPDHLSAARDPRPWMLHLDTPWHFPVRNGDGLGQLQREAHRKASANMGVDDLGRWTTYARLFDIDFWERVLSKRYAERKRAPGFVSTMEAEIGRIIHFNRDRVHKKRSLISDLKQGRPVPEIMWR